MSGGRAPRRFAIALVIGVSLLLSACVGLPTDGNVETEPIDTTTNQGPLQTIPLGPQVGATPEQIVQGFIRAGRGPQNGYRAARDFLTDDFSTQWKPNAEVSITDTPIAPVREVDGTFTVTVIVSARVNSTGNYTELATPETQQFHYAFEQNADDEWRIASTEDGTIISSNRFDGTFQSYELYYFDPSGEYLVPDLRWFPDTQTTKDRIVTELLAGQSPWLGGGVLVSAFPPGTELGEGGVTIDDGLAQVELSSNVRAQSESAKRRMQQQLTASLDSLGDVQSVEMTAGGFPVVITDGGSQPARALPVSPNPLVLVDGTFGYLSTGGTVLPIADLSAPIEALGPSGVTLARGRDDAAVLSAAGATLVPAGGDPVLLDGRAGLVTPSLDVEGYLWSVPALPSNSLESGLLAIDSEGAAQLIPLPISAGSQVASIDVSRDGARLLVAVNTPEGPQLLALGIVRDNSLAPTGLGQPLTLAVGGGALIDAAWLSGVQVAAIAQGGAGNTISAYELGGKRTELGFVVDARGIAGGNDLGELRVVDGAGMIFRPSGDQGWQATSVVASFLGTQQ